MHNFSVCIAAHALSLATLLIPQTARAQVSQRVDSSVIVAAIRAPGARSDCQTTCAQSHSSFLPIGAHAGSTATRRSRSDTATRSSSRSTPISRTIQLSTHGSIRSSMGSIGDVIRTSSRFFIIQSSHPDLMAHQLWSVLLLRSASATCRSSANTGSICW